MKVLLINDYFELIGGAEQLFHSTKTVLEENGHSVRIYAPLNTGSAAGKLFSLKHYFAVRREIHQFGPDIIHVHGVYRNISPSVLVAARHLNVPIVMTLHDFQVVCPKTSLVNENHNNCETGFSLRCFYSNCYPRKSFNRIYQGLKTIKLCVHRAIIKRLVTHFLSPSNCLMNWTRDNLGIQNISLLPNFILSGHEPFPDQPFNNTFLYIGKLVEQKGIDILIKAVAIVRNVFPEVRLKIVGEGPDEHTFKKLAANLRLSDIVSWTGQLTNEQVMAEYDDALCVVIPSKYVENCSIVGIEAISKGKIVVASRIGGLPDIVDDNENGFLVRPGDPDDLAEKIIYVMQNRAILPGMGERARAKFLRTFSKAAYYQTLHSVYDRIIHEHRNRNSQLR